MGHKVVCHRFMVDSYPSGYQLPEKEDYYYIEVDSRKFSSEKDLFNAVDLKSEKEIRDIEIKSIVKRIEETTLGELKHDTSVLNDALKYRDPRIVEALVLHSMVLLVVNCAMENNIKISPKELGKIELATLIEMEMDQKDYEEIYSLLIKCIKKLDEPNYFTIRRMAESQELVISRSALFILKKIHSDSRKTSE